MRVDQNEMQARVYGREVGDRLQVTLMAFDLIRDLPSRRFCVEKAALGVALFLFQYIEKSGESPGVHTTEYRRPTSI